MQQEGFTPDKFTFLSILRPCADVGVLEWVRKVHVLVLQAGLGSHLLVSNALIYVYAKSGSVEDARLVFEGLVERDVITWNAMIGEYVGIGCGHEAYGLFLQMQRVGVLPNATTYLSLLNARASAGGLKWVKQAHRNACEGRLESNLRVGNALIHMYAKSGSLDDARLLFDKMVERDIITYNLMIGALAQHGLGREALQLHKQIRAECLQPNGQTFVAILSAYSHADLVDEDRSLMKERGLRKELGRSWIEVEDHIHHFVVVEVDHPEMEYIYAELSRLSEKIKAEGYIPDTRLVLHNIEDKDKELALCSHSEKLAIAYGLIADTPCRTNSCTQ